MKMNSMEVNSISQSTKENSTKPKGKLLERRKSRSLSCPINLDDLKRERFCQSKVNIDRMDRKNLNKLSLPNGGSDSDTIPQQGVENGSPAGKSADSLRSTPEPSPPFNSESFARRRASSINLAPLKIPGLEGLDGQEAAKNGGAEVAKTGGAAADDVNETVLLETTDETIELFNEFLVHELQSSNLQPPADLQENIQSARVQHTATQTNQLPNSPTPPTATPTGYKHPKWAKRGKGLRKLADDFSKTRERNKVRSKASGVEVESITWEEFRDLLSELFPRNIITRERIVVLFFFCTDLAILALQQNHVELFHRFVRWTLEFIKNKVCVWVANQGGWGVVLSSSVDYLYRGAQIVAAGVLIYFAYKLLTNANSNTSNK